VHLSARTSVCLCVSVSVCLCVCVCVCKVINCVCVCVCDNKFTNPSYCQFQPIRKKGQSARAGPQNLDSCNSACGRLDFLMLTRGSPELLAIVARVQPCRKRKGVCNREAIRSGWSNNKCTQSLWSCCSQSPA
jgi:hypothetical protein